MKKFIFILMFIASASLMSFSLMPNVSAAAQPGCYERWLVDTAGIAVGTVDCSVYSVWFPGWQQDAPGKCWMVDLNSAGVASPSNPPSAVDCNTVTVTTTTNLDGTSDTTQTAQSRKDAQQTQQTLQQNGTVPVSECGKDGSSPSDCETASYMTKIINILSGLVGIIVVIMIIVGGIQYSAAGGDPSKIAAAKKRIYSALLALVTFLLLFAFLQWLVPGGVL